MRDFKNRKILDDLSESVILKNGIFSGIIMQTDLILKIKN